MTFEQRCVPRVAILIAARTGSGITDAAVATRFPELEEANGKVGPPLSAFALRVYIAGEAPNTPDDLRHCIRNPHAIEQHTAMPEMGVSDGDSRDIAAYLYTLH